MQIINGYDKTQHRKRNFAFRLFHLNHPRVKDWRKTRHKLTISPDAVEEFVIDQVADKKIVALDCAGWVMTKFGFVVQSFESDPLALHYDPNCHVEPDLLVHRPTYTMPWPVLARFPWYLKYAKIQDFVNFLELWTRPTMILNFHERYVQHNHLKYDLVDLVRPMTSLRLDKISQDLWFINRDQV